MKNTRACLTSQCKHKAVQDHLAHRTAVQTTVQPRASISAAHTRLQSTPSLSCSAANTAAALATLQPPPQRSTPTMPTSKKMLAKARDIEKKLAALDGPEWASDSSDDEAAAPAKPQAAPQQPKPGKKQQKPN